MFRYQRCHAVKPSIRLLFDLGDQLYQDLLEWLEFDRSWDLGPLVELCDGLLGL